MENLTMIFFKKKIKICRYNKGYKAISTNYPFSHAEYICSITFFENPKAEIILHTIVGNSMKNSGVLLFNSLCKMINDGIKLINISAGIENVNHKEIRDICELAKNKNVTIAASYPNLTNISYPAKLNTVIGVKKIDTIKTDQFFIYDSTNKDILFNKNAYVSCVQLNQKHLLQGNSFLTAKITGIISNTLEKSNITNIDNTLTEIETCILNKTPNFIKYKSKKVLCIPDRPQDDLQKMYVKKCLGNSYVISIDKLTPCIAECSFDACVIDIANFEYFINNRHKIYNLIYENRLGSFYLQYPLFSFKTRFNIYHNCGILIEQMYL